MPLPSPRPLAPRTNRATTPDPATSLLGTLGKIAGIGGIAMGVLLILFRRFIEQSVQHVERADAARLLQMFLLFTFAIAVIGLVVWASQVKMAKALLVALLMFATVVTGVGWAVMRPAAPGVYQLRVTVLSPQRTPVDDAKVTTNVGGEPSRVAGGWQFDIPDGRLPASREVKVFAEQANAFTHGKTTVSFGEQRVLATEIVLAKDTSATVRGIVVNRAGKAVAGARVSVVGFDAEGVVTGADGGFELKTHAAEGQSVRVHAEKDRMAVNQEHPAGGAAMTVMLR